MTLDFIFPLKNRKFNNKSILIFIFLVCIFSMVFSVQEALALSKEDLSGTYYTQIMRFENFEDQASRELLSKRMQINFKDSKNWIANGYEFNSNNETVPINLSGTFSVNKDTFVLHGFDPLIEGILTRNNNAMMLNFLSDNTQDSVMMGLGVSHDMKFDTSDFKNQFLGTGLIVEDFENRDDNLQGLSTRIRLESFGDGSGTVPLFASASSNDEVNVNRNRIMDYATSNTFFEFNLPNLDTSPLRRFHPSKNRNFAISNQSDTDIEAGSIKQGLRSYVSNCNETLELSDLSGTYIVRTLNLVDLQENQGNRQIEQQKGFLSFNGNGTGTITSTVINSNKAPTNSDIEFSYEKQSELSYLFNLGSEEPDLGIVYLSCNRDLLIRQRSESLNRGKELKFWVAVKIRNRLDEVKSGECIIEESRSPHYFKQYLRKIRDFVMNHNTGRVLVNKYYLLSKYLSP